MLSREGVLRVEFPFVALLGVLVASALVLPAEAAPKAYSCNFEAGGAWAFEQGTFAAKAAEQLNFVVADINEGAQTARLKGPGGEAPLKIVQALGANHFIEVAMEGFLNITTIYEPQAAVAQTGVTTQGSVPSGAFPAVHSRHFAVLGEPLVSQYRGTCLAQ